MMNFNDTLKSLDTETAAAYASTAAHLCSQWQPATVSPDFTSRLMAAVDNEAAKLRPSDTGRFWNFGKFPVFKLAAAAVIILTGLALLHSVLRAQPSDIAWLASTQEKDGLWEPALHGGNTNYKPAITALAALALDRDQRGRYKQAVANACGALTALQNPDGTFSSGRSRESYYNHAMATYAIATLATDPSADASLKRAVAAILKGQSPQGGWDYEPGSEGNSAITAWNIRALAAAEKRGITEASMPLKKGLRWLRNNIKHDGRVAYNATSTASSDCLTALAAFSMFDSAKEYPELAKIGKMVISNLEPSSPSAGMDSYRDYAKTIAFNAAGDLPRTAASRSNMLTTRSAGSDAWEMVGGHLYTAALTVLAQL